MTDLAIHPAAESFPLMDPERFEELKQDIRANGLRLPIVLCDGKILDGRNRYRACRELGIALRTEQAAGDPWAYVWSVNGERRDLVAEQRYLIWKECHERSESWQAQQAAIAEAGNRKRSETQAGRPKTRGVIEPATEFEKLTGWPEEVWTGEYQRQEREGTVCAPTLHPSRYAKAKASQTNRGAVERGDRLAEQRPDLAEKVRRGTLKPSEAHRQARRDAVHTKVSALPDGQYRVIYADPPWQYNDQRMTADHRESTAATFHYPTMSFAELAALPVRTLAAPDAACFLWATFPLLPSQLDILTAWGFTYKTAFVWDKGRGSFGHYHDASAELLLLGTRGSCTPDTDQREPQIIRFPRSNHSAKPEALRAMIDRLYPHGPRIELFCRGDAPTPPWVAWGAELAK